MTSDAFAQDNFDHDESMTDESVADDRVVAAVKHYLSLLEAGNAPSTSEYLKQHAEIADSLRPALDGLAMIHRAAEPRKSPVAAAPDAEFTSKPIGDFQIVGELGRGGMGVVYEAIQLSLGRKVALKVLPFASGLDEVRLQRFRNEAHAAAALHHTNIVPVYAVGSDRGVHFYAMQLIQGQTLADVIQQMRQANGKTDAATAHIDLSDTVAISPPNAANVAYRKTPPATATSTTPSTSQTTIPHRPPASDTLSTVLAQSVSERTQYYRRMVKMIHQAAVAIQHAHQYGVIHRDIKPGNLLLDFAGQIWVTDFGLAQIQHADSNMTRTGDPLGTLKYMSPEQAAGNRAIMDHRTDIYSLGVTLYELLTLEPAIKGDNYLVMLNQVAQHEPPPPKSVDPSLPTELDTIIRKAIAKSPGDRYASAQALADDLQRWLDDKPIAAKPPTMLERLAKWRRRNSGLVATASIVLMAATLGLLATTVMIYRALDRETQQRELAEASFLQAKSAVDQFSNLSEAELAYRPDLQDLRRDFLETSLTFYQEFLQRRSEDPQVAAELSATSERVQNMVEELRLLDNIEPMLMLSNQAVQQDVGIDEATATAVTAAVNAFQSERETLAVRYVGSLQSDNSEMSDLLRAFESTMSQYVTPEQTNRLRQIGRQLRLPFTFKSSEVVNQLKLTQTQRETISRIIEETRPGRDDPNERRRNPGGRERDGRKPPRSPFDFGPPPDGFGGGPPPFVPDHERFGPNGPRPDGPRPDGPGPHGPGSHGPGPDRGGFGGPGFRSGVFNVKHPEVIRNTVNEILKILTPQQRETWHTLVGEPFNFQFP